MTKLNCFKAYDIRGQLGEELNDEIAYRIGRAFGIWLHTETPDTSISPQTVVLGGDIRLTSESLKQALASGLMDEGVNVIDLGMTGTEEIYFATKHLRVSGGIEVTASHNPIDFNGMKLVREDSKPISGDSGLRDIQALAEEDGIIKRAAAEHKGTLTRQSCLTAYIEHLLGYITPQQLRPLKLVVNAGNGAAGHIIDAIEAQFKQNGIPVDFIKVHHQPDGTFPNGIPNPLLPECRAATSDAITRHNADMGIAWDGDFDRCFLFDETGRFIEGYYIVGLLAEAFLQKHPGEKIIHDPRLTWNTIDIVNNSNGTPIQSKTGHAFIKERMRAENAIYGGEMSAHHYFRDFAYCDSGMIPWLLVAELLSVKEKPLSALVNERMAAYPCSGEINFRVSNPEQTIADIKHFYLSSANEADQPTQDHTDGVSIAFSDWRFNLRSSNTEPVIRLNIETRGNQALMLEKTKELSSLIDQESTQPPNLSN